MDSRSRYFPAAKRRVLKEVLGPAGFVRGNSIYVAKIGSQIHGIDFQASRRGDGYFVNLLFHYDFLPGFFQGKIVAYSKMHYLDMLFSSRLDDFFPPQAGQGIWYYTEDRDFLEQTLAENATNAISVLENQGEKWRNPAILLELVPPELIEKDLAGGYIDRSGIIPLEASYVLDALEGHWHFDDFGLSYALAHFAARLRKTSLMRKYLEIARKLVEFDSQKRLIDAFAKKHMVH
jgi:hypothetical protein